MRRRDFIAGISAAAWPLARSLAADAQHRTVPVIGYLSGGGQDDLFRAGFHKGLSEQGFVTGRNV